MAYLPLINVVPQFFDNLGDPLVGGTLNAYIAGTSTPTNMFSDNTGTVAGTSVTLDSRGEPTTIKLIWLDTDVSYKFILKDSTGATIWTEDNIQVTSVQDGSITESKIATGAVTNSKIATDAVTSSKIIDSAVSTSKIADNSVTSAKMKNSGYEFGIRNKIINGAMNISQRGTSFAAAATGYTLDRWRFEENTVGVCTVSQSSDVPANTEFQNSLRIAVTTADTSISAGDICTIEHRIEGFNVRDLVGRTFTISFWVRSTKTGTHCVSFQNSTANRSWVSEYTVNVADTWEFKSITLTDGLITAGTWDFTTGIGLAVVFTLASGSAYQSASGAWQTGDFLSTSNQVNCLDSTSNVFSITGVQLESGTAYTPFEYKTYDLDFASCQRYYERGGTNSFRFVTSVVGVYPSRGFAVTKRASPTMSFTIASGTGGSASSTANGFVQDTNNSVESSVQWSADAEL